MENKHLREKLEEAQLELKLKQDELNRMCEEMSRITGTTINRSVLVASTSSADSGVGALLPTMAITNAAGDVLTAGGGGDGTQRTLTAVYLQQPTSNNGAGQHVLSNGTNADGGAGGVINSASDQQQHQYGSATGTVLTTSTVNPGYFTIGKLS